MKKPKDRTQLFHAPKAAKRISGDDDPSDALDQIYIGYTKALDLAMPYVLAGDFSRPWALLDPASRGDALVSYQLEAFTQTLFEHASRLLELGGVFRGDDGPRSADVQSERQIVRDFSSAILKLTPEKFDTMQVSRGEVARWLAHMEIDSAYQFDQQGESDHIPVTVTTPSPAPNPLSLTRGQVQILFDGIHFSAEQWKTNLQSPKEGSWLKKCRTKDPKTGNGGWQSEWDVLKIATELAINGRIIRSEEGRYAAVKKLDRLFEREDSLEPIKAEWEEFRELLAY